MRRVLGIMAAALLVASLASSGVVATEAAPADRFIGEFEVLAPDGSGAVATVSADLQWQSAGRLVPGHFDLYGLPGSGQPAEIHAQFGYSRFWWDPAYKSGANVAYAEGVACAYDGVGFENQRCGEFAVMFIELPSPVAGEWEWRRELTMSWERLETSPWGCCWAWDSYPVGKGSFVLRYTWR